MQRLRLTILAAVLGLCVVAGDALAWGRSHRHHHHRLSTSFHFGISAYLPPFSFSWFVPFYAAPEPYYGTYSAYRPSPYRPAPYRSSSSRKYGLVLDFPLAIWTGLDRVDRAYASTSTYRALEVTRSGEIVAWHNPGTGASGTVSPRPAFPNPRGEACREFWHTVSIDGHTQSAHGLACRQPDGGWRMVQ